MKENRIGKAFSKVHAPEGVLREVEMKISEKDTNETRNKPVKYRKSVIIAVAVAAVLTVSAAAYGLIHSAFYNNAFGTGVEGYPGGPRDLLDRDGNLVKTVTEPAVERVDVNRELAEQLIGSHVATVGESVKAGEFTVTVEECVFDENGIGTVSVLISHPDGHTKYNEEWFQANYMNFAVEDDGFDYARGEETGISFPGSKGYVAKGDSDGSDYRIVYYVCPMTLEQETDDIEYYFRAPTPLMQKLAAEHTDPGATDYSYDELREEVRIRIPADDRVPAERFLSEDGEISISPLGAKLTLEKAGYMRTFVITFTDGTEYIVCDPDHSSFGEGTLDDDVFHFAFNRLVDVESIISVRIVTGDGTELIYVPED